MLINIKEPLLWPSSLLNSLHIVLSLTEVFTYCNYRVSFTLRLYSSLIGLSFNPTGRFKIGWWHLIQVQYRSISGLLISYIPFLLSKFWNCPATAQGSSLSYRFSLSPSIFFSYSASSFFYFCVAVDTVGNIFLLINSFLAFIEPVLFLVFSLLGRPFFFLVFLISFFGLFSVSSHSAGDSTRTCSLPYQFCYRKTWDLRLNDPSTFSEFMFIKRETFCLLKYYPLV